MRIEEIPVTSGSQLIGQALREAGIGQHTGAVIVGIVNPSDETTLSAVHLSAGDALVALGSEEQLKQLREFAARAR